ncbi:hypothetical protein B0H13DRAFT_2383727 [Mycena leptocephala]|nr:hypothetical protein B0H13DRAFT_2383727 [Mycena leptocephala]
MPILSATTVGVGGRQWGIIVSSHAALGHTHALSASWRLSSWLLWCSGALVLCLHPPPPVPRASWKVRRCLLAGDIATVAGWNENVYYAAFSLDAESVRGEVTDDEHAFVLGVRCLILASKARTCALAGGVGCEEHAVVYA